MMGERLGEMLVARGVCSAETRDHALALQREQPARLGGILVEKLGVAERAVAEALAAQLGTPALVLRESALLRKNVELVPAEVCRTEGLLPVDADELTVKVAFTGPPSSRLLTEVEFATGRQVVALVAVESCLKDRLRQLRETEGELLRGEAISPDARVPPGGHLVLIRPAPRAEDSVEIDVDMGPEPLPVDGPTWKTPPKPAEVPPAGSRPRVLVVDDVPELRAMVVRALSPDGYALAEAGTGQEALSQIQVFAPQLIVLDAMLPEVHGFEICRALKRSPAWQHIVVIMVSAIYKGWDYARDIQDVYGADLFLEKPFNVAFLRERVRTMLEARSATTGGAPGTRPDLSREIRDEAHTLLQMGDLPGALLACANGLTLDPFDARLHAIQADAYARQGHRQHAMVAYERALQFAPNSYPVLKNLALLYEQEGLRRRAAAAWQRALEACPDVRMRERIRARLLMELQT
ncbi:MAG: response regulator [Myxococcota bacterium]